MTSFASRAPSRPKPVRLHLEALADRLVPSYFPSTADGIHIFEDQLPSNLSAAMTRFVATHLDGTQKEQLAQTDQFRAIKPSFTSVLAYRQRAQQQPGGDHAAVHAYRQRGAALHQRAGGDVRRRCVAARRRHSR